MKCPECRGEMIFKSKALHGLMICARCGYCTTPGEASDKELSREMMP